MNAQRQPVLGRGGGGVGGVNRFAPREKPKNAKGTFLRILKLYTRWGKTIFVAMLLTMVSVGLSVSVPYFIGKAFNTLSLGTLAVDTTTLYTLLVAIVALYLGSWAINTTSSVIMLRVSQKLVFVLRTEFFNKMQRLPLQFYDGRSHGDTMSRLANDVDQISGTLSSTTTQLLQSVLTIAGSLTVMLSLSLPLTGAVLVAVPLVTLLTRLITRRSRNYFLAQSRALGTLNGIIEENILGLAMVKAYGRQPDVIAAFSDVNERLYDASYHAQTWAGFMMPLMNVINNLTFALVAIVGGALSVGSGLPVGTVISFLSYAKQFGNPLNNIAGMFNTIAAALAGAERVFEILDQAEEAPDVPHALPIVSIKGNVRFDDVCFSYDSVRPVLSHISFDVPAGAVIALVGETGSGKTTIVNLLTRFYDADSGAIYVDGVDILAVTRDSLHRCFSVVLQETCLFSGTIMDNIRYARPDADDAAVLAAARLSHAHDFIEKLPDGYQTMVSGSTATLSEGQRQLLAIARAVLVEAPILILDEATSAVDTKTEKNIQQALTALMKGHTSFLIAHRLSTIHDADRILVLAKGQIVESGNHQELMELKGQYFEMVESQLGA